MRHIILCLLIPSLTIAQPKPLSIGDTIPHQQLQYLKTFRNSPLSLQAQQSNGARGGVGSGARSIIILDFFATFCTACIKELPKLDSLKQNFGEKLQIIIVAAESMQKLEALKSKNKIVANCKLPMLTGDTIFKKLFRHRALPHEVWLDRNGKVLAITDQYAITAANITEYLNGGYVSLPLKADALDFNSREPLLIDNNGGTTDDLLFGSKLTRYLQGVNSSNGIIRGENNTRWYMINFPVLSLYREALEFTPNQVITHLHDSSLLFIPGEPSIAWKEKNLFSWEFTGPKNISKQQMQSFLLQDLDRWLGLHGRMEKRKVKCLAISRISNVDTLLRTKQGTPAVRSTDDGNILFVNQPFSKIVSGLNTARSSVPGSPVFLDETGISFNVDLCFPKAAKGDLELLKKTLSSYNMQLMLVDREIDMFILSENIKH